MNFIQEQKLAKQIILKSGRLLKDNFNNFDRSKRYKIKSKTQIQTWIDRASEKIILSEIKKQFPDHHFLSEEIGDNQKKSDYFWIIDPLDGTTNYSIHNPLYGVSIALAYKNKVVLGVTYLPEFDELTIARAGQGVWLNNKKIHASKIKTLPKAMLTFCHGSLVNHMKAAIKLYGKFKLRGLDFRQLGSAVCELNFVAQGRTEAIMIPGANIYDVAAGALIVKEAGGQVTDFNNQAWTIRSKDILASNSLVHSRVLKIIKET